MPGALLVVPLVAVLNAVGVYLDSRAWHNEVLAATATELGNPEDPNIPGEGNKTLDQD